MDMFTPQLGFLLGHKAHEILSILPWHPLDVGGSKLAQTSLLIHPLQLFVPF